MVFHITGQPLKFFLFFIDIKFKCIEKYLPCKHHNYQFFHQTDCTDHSKTLKKPTILVVFNIILYIR